MNNRNICENNPKDDRCDVVQYAEQLDAEQHTADMEKLTVGKQPGYTKASVDSVMKEFKK